MMPQWGRYWAGYPCLKPVTSGQPQDEERCGVLKVLLHGASFRLELRSIKHKKREQAAGIGRKKGNEIFVRYVLAVCHLAVPSRLRLSPQPRVP